MSRFLPTLIVTLAALPGTALAAPDKPQTGPLSSNLYELSSPAVRDAPASEQALALSLPFHGPGSLTRDPQGRAMVQVVADGRLAERLPGLEQAGAEIVDVTPRYDTITASIAPEDLRAAAKAPGVQSIVEVLQPMTGRVDGDPGAATGAINTCATGVVTEGNTQLRAGAARTQFDVDGSGIKVGILSDSYDTKTNASKHAVDDVASNDLPGATNSCGRTTPVQVLQDFTCTPATSCGDEGRAMLQIVHDIAPGASLAFATADAGDTSFAANIRALANAGARVIADDIIYLNEPMFQDGVIANAVTDVTNQGVAYFSMAFNNNVISGGSDVGSFEAPAFRPSAFACPLGLSGFCMDFNPSAATDDNTYGISVPNGATLKLDLQWAQPQNGVTTDFDAYLTNTGLATAPHGDDFNVSTTQKPFEFLSYQNTSGATQTVGLVINRFTGAGGGDSGTPRLKVVFFGNGAQSMVPTEYTTSGGGDIVGPTIFGHNGTAAAQTIGAIPFNDSSAPEVFSSRGPVTHYFGPVNGTTPAAALVTPEVLSKPDVAATDKGITTFFGAGNRFSGTSAATPHAAAVGALQLSANPSLGQAQVKQAQKTTARPVGAFGPLAVGSGLIDAQAAIASQPPAPPSVVFTSGPTGATSTPTPTFTFTAGPHVSAAVCSVDGGPGIPCTDTYTPGPLADGAHTAAVTATDYFGQSTTATQAFVVSSVPDTLITNPKRKVYSKRAKYKFVSNVATSTFQCRIDGGRWQTCSSGVRVVHLRLGPHKFEVRAVNGTVVDPAPAADRFIRKHRRGRHL